MACIYYTCNLVPLGMIHSHGLAVRWLGDHLQDASSPARRDALGIHFMTCPYVTRLVAAADVLLAGSEDNAVVVPAGCDAMRRLGDLLAAFYPERVLVLSMPRSSVDGAVVSLAAELARLDRWLAERAQVEEEEGADGSPTIEPPSVEYAVTPQSGGVFVVAGPLSDDSLLRMIRQLGAVVAGLESCTSPDRWGPLLTADIVRSEETAPYAVAAYKDLAATILRVGMCPRRSTLDRRTHLARRLDETQPSSIIYGRQSFCDPGAYDALEVARLAAERGLPFLEVEVGFPFESSGPLRTRVEAFLEAQLLDDDLLDDLDDLDDDLLDDDLADDLRDGLGAPDAGELMREEG